MNKSSGPVYTEHHRQHCNNCVMSPAILFSLKTTESIKNGFQPQSGLTPLFSMRTISLTSLQRCLSNDVDAWCEQALTLGLGLTVQGGCIQGSPSICMGTRVRVRITTCEHCASRFPDDRIPALIWPACIAPSNPTTSINLSPTSVKTSENYLIFLLGFQLNLSWGLLTPSESKKDQTTSEKDQRINGKHQRKFSLSLGLNIA